MQGRPDLAVAAYRPSITLPLGGDDIGCSYRSSRRPWCDAARETRVATNGASSIFSPKSGFAGSRRPSARQRRSLALDGLQRRYRPECRASRPVLRGYRHDDVTLGFHARDVGVLGDLVIADDVEDAVGLLQRGLGEHVALGVLVHVALAFLIDEDLRFGAAPRCR